MAQFTIDLPDRLLPGIQAVVARHNADNGAALTVGDWLTRHVAEVAVQDEFLAEQGRLAAQAQEELEAALRSLRKRMVNGE